MSGRLPVGLLLGAGRGRRMGEQTKQLLPWPPGSGQTMIEASFDLLAPFCAAMFVVLDHDADAISAALSPRSFTEVRADGDAPMFASVCAGLQVIAAEHDDVAVLLHPADHPAVRAGTIQYIIDASDNNPSDAIMPHHGDRGGHPVLIPHTLCTKIIDYDGRNGLRGYWQLHPANWRRITTDDAAATTDIDTPEQYQSLGNQHRP